MTKKYAGAIVIVFVLGTVAYFLQPKAPGSGPGPITKVYWFIPDGMRADPDIFNIYRWAQEGRLPNIKKMMDRGAYGYSIPDFPSHTPTNWASLMTGTHPLIHGVTDGPMHAEGAPLNKPAVPGFSSVAKRVDPIWKMLEAAGKKVALLSIPGSTPPELKNGITIRGRWAPWGFDTPAVIFEPTEKLAEMKSVGNGFKLFYLGQKLTQFIDKNAASDWADAPRSFSPAQEFKMDTYGATIWGLVYDSTDDGTVNYDSIRFSQDKKTSLGTLKQGEWSGWMPVALMWKDQPVASNMKFKVIKLWEGGNFRVRVFFNNVNEFLTEPASVAKELTDAVGPMVDFVDNWPAQLIYEDEDKETFLEEAEMSLDWHKAAAGFILDRYEPDFFIQDTYTPNQMLESRWWHRKIAGSNFDYNTADSAASEWDDIYWMYKKLDDILEEAMKHLDENSVIILSSDHGIIPVYKQLKLNNLFAKKGWLKYTIDAKTGEPTIDWERSTVVYLKMAYVYINPNGLGGAWKHGSGAEFEKLRNEVIQALAEIEDDNGVRPVANSIKWEDAPAFFELPTDRIGDLVIEAVAGYQLWEEVDVQQEVFGEPLASGYKQAVDPKTTKGLWSPFMIVGPGVKRGYAIPEPISHVDQLPTIFKLLNIEIPAKVEGKVLTDILK